jgi:hypothetical protein
LQGSAYIWDKCFYLLLEIVGGGLRPPETNEFPTLMVGLAHAGLHG